MLSSEEQGSDLLTHTYNVDESVDTGLLIGFSARGTKKFLTHLMSEKQTRLSKGVKEQNVVCQVLFKSCYHQIINNKKK